MYHVFIDFLTKQNKYLLICVGILHTHKILIFIRKADGHCSLAVFIYRFDFGIYITIDVVKYSFELFNYKSILVPG
jgi:hypothetical protein